MSNEVKSRRQAILTKKNTSFDPFRNCDLITKNGEVMKQSKRSNRQVSIPAKIAYGLGHGLITMKVSLFSFFFLFYFSNIEGVPAWIVGMIAFAAVIFDAITDPLMGQISDNHQPRKWGRRHGFMLWSIIPTALVLYLLFAPPASLDDITLILWMVVFTFLARLGTTIYGVPYFALSAELSTDYNERTSITAFRELFNNLFNLVLFFLAFAVFLPESAEFEDGMMNKAGYAPLACALATIAIILSFISTFGTRHKIPDLPTMPENERTRWTQTFREIAGAARNQNFLFLAIGFSLLIILFGASSALSIYMGVYLWQFSQTAKFVVAIAPFMSLIPAILLATYIPKKIDKKPAVLLFSFIYMICNLLPYLGYRMGVMPGSEDTNLLLIVAGFNAFAYSGLTATIVIASSMLADVADEIELETGRRQEGMIYAVYTFANKMTFAVGTLVASVALTILAFPEQANPSDVPQSKINGLADISMVMAIVIGLAAIFCIMRYNLSRDRLGDIQGQLRSTAD